MEKYDFLDKNRKPTLKERVKRVVALALTLGTLAGFTACKTQTGKTTDTSNTIPNPPSISTMTDNSVTEPEEPIFTTIDNGTTGPEHTDPIPAEIPVAEINAFAESLKGGNFTTYAANTTRKQVGDMVELEMPGEFHKIVSLEDGINYVYDYDATQDKWTKDFLEVPVEGPFTNAYNQLFKQTTWNSYDEKTGEISGIWTPSEELVSQYQGVNETVDVVLKLTESGAELSFLGANARIFDINKTQISLPQTYIDNTIENNDIYTVDEQGNYDFNLVLMKEVLLDWMKGNNQWGKDVYAHISKSDAYRTDDIVYINASLTDVRMGVMLHIGNDTYFYENYIKDDSFYTKLASQEIKTKEDFQQYLNSILPKRFGYADTQIKLDTSLSNSDFETVTKNIFNHLVNVGTQSSINEEGVKHPEYADAKVLFGFALKGSASIGFDMGNIESYAFYYFLESNDEIKLMQIWVEAQNKIENAINDVQGKWLVSSINYKQSINKSNEDILPEEKFITAENNYQKEMEL